MLISILLSLIIHLLVYLLHQTLHTTLNAFPAHLHLLATMSDGHSDFALFVVLHAQFHANGNSKHLILTELESWVVRVGVVYPHTQTRCFQLSSNLMSLIVQHLGIIILELDWNDHQLDLCYLRGKYKPRIVRMDHDH